MKIPLLEREGLAMLMTLTGATVAVDPETMTRNVRGAVRRLSSLFVYSLTEAERREANGQEATMMRTQAIALGLAVRVLLHPDAQAVVRECAKADE